MKRLVVCCDGTWQDLSKDYPTNVVKMAQAVKTRDATVPQIVFYGQGIGSGGELVNRIGGGAFGWGIDQNIQDAYRFLCLNYDPGDEIYLFGFSRGAYTVRSLAGLIRCAGGLYPLNAPSRGGLLPRNEIRRTPAVYEIYRSRVHDENQERDEAKKRKIREQEFQRKTREMESLSPNMQKDVRIKLLGCWDTVGSLGMPRKFGFLSELANKRYEFHDYKLSGIIDNALHAVAIDERRKVFDVTPMEQSESNKQAGQKLRQVWFPGNHGCVGGGTREIRGLSDAALQWMMNQMNDWELGLELDPNLVEHDLQACNPDEYYGIRPNPKTEFQNKFNCLFWLGGGMHDRQIAKSNEKDLSAILKERLHDSVMKRWDSVLDYRPKNLEKFKDAIEKYLEKAAQAAQDVAEKAQDTAQDVAKKAQDTAREAIDNLTEMATQRSEQTDKAQEE